MTEPYLPYQPHALDNMNTTLEAGNQTVLRQAPITTNEYLMSAIDHIDQAHPELTDATASPIAASIPSLGFGSSLSTAQLREPARRVQGAGLRCHWPSNSPGIEMRVENQGELTTVRSAPDATGARWFQLTWWSLKVAGQARYMGSAVS
jgi:hypothetical protein